MLKSVERYLFSFRKGRYERKILEAMDFVDRKDFVDGDFVYEDTALPIGGGQTISQPSTVARMLQLLDLREGCSVLEVGGGSGWNASLIGFLVGESGKVLSLEIIESLIEKMKRVLKKRGVRNVEVLKKDFRKLSEKFDRIVFAAGILEGEEKIIFDFARRCLNEGGILVCPHRSGSLIVLKNRRGVLEKSYSEDLYVFVELVL